MTNGATQLKGNHNRAKKEEPSIGAIIAIDAILTLVLGLGVFYEKDPDLVKRYPFGRVMDHSNRVARYARRLTQEYEPNCDVVSLVITAGLLHDIGLQIITSVAPALWRGILEPGACTEKSLKEIEVEVLGIWGLPSDVVKLTLHQDKNEDSPPLDICE